MTLPNGLTDEQVYVIYATQFANINVRLQDLVQAARDKDPSLITTILDDWQTADINKSRARLRLLVNQSAEVTQLVKDFLGANKNMTDALQNLQALPEAIADVTGLIDSAVSLGTSLIDKAPQKQ